MAPTPHMAPEERQAGVDELHLLLQKHAAIARRLSELLDATVGAGLMPEGEELDVLEALTLEAEAADARIQRLAAALRVRIVPGKPATPTRH